MLLKSIQSQLVTIQPQLKRKKKEKYTGEPKRLFIIANASSNLELQIQGPERGYPLRSCFLQFCKKDFEKENKCFGEGEIFEFVKVCFFLVLLMAGH